VELTWRMSLLELARCRDDVRRQLWVRLKKLRLVKLERTVCCGQLDGGNGVWHKSHCTTFGKYSSDQKYKVKS